MWMDEADVLVARLQAVFANWHLHAARADTQRQYLAALQELLALLEASLPAADGAEMSRRGVAASLARVAVAHCSHGAMSFAAQQTWVSLLHVLLPAVRAEVSLSHLVPPLWDTVVRLTRDGGATPALCASLQVLRALLTYCPCELVMRRQQLPHLQHAASVSARVAAVSALPWIVCNLKQPAAAGPSSGAAASAHVAATLNPDCLEYVKRGLAAVAPPAVREATVHAVATMLEMGVTLDAAANDQLLDALLELCASARAPPPPAATARIGTCIGYLLALRQCGPGASASWSVRRLLAAGGGGGGAGGEPPPLTLSWQYIGGGGSREEAAALARKLFRPRTTRSHRTALAAALTALLTLCVWPGQTADALRCLFVFLIPVEGDDRAYVPALLTAALRDYARGMVSNAPRVVLVARLREYLRPAEQRVVRHTALLVLRAVLPALVSCREVSQALADDLRAAALSDPALLQPASEVLAALNTGAPHLLRRCLDEFVDRCHQLPSDDCGDTLRVPATFLLLARTVLAMPPGLPELRRPLLTAAVYFGSTDPPRTVQPYHHRQMELFFRLCRPLLEHYRRHLSPFTEGKLTSAADAQLGVLVASPSVSSSSYLRASIAACQLLAAKGPTESELFLAVGLLEGQLVSDAATAAAPPGSRVGSGGDAAGVEALRTKLFGHVYRLVSATPWRASDDGSLRWAISQALTTLEMLSAAGAHALVDADATGPRCGGAGGSTVVPGAAFLSRFRPHAPHSADADGAAEAATAAAQLVAIGVRRFCESNDRFCRGLLERVKLLMDGACAASADARGGAPTAWNAMCLADAILAAALETPAHAEAARRVYRGKLASYCAGWHAFAQRWQSSGALDLRWLAARVSGAAMCVAGTTDARTTAAMQRGVQAALGELPALLEAHGHHARAGEPAPTYPIAVSLLAETLRRTGLHGDGGDAGGATPSVALLCCVRAAEAWPEMLRESFLLDALLQAALCGERADSLALASPDSAALTCVLVASAMADDVEAAPPESADTSADALALLATAVLDGVLRPTGSSLLAAHSADAAAPATLARLLERLVRGAAVPLSRRGRVCTLVERFLTGTLHPACAAARSSESGDVLAARPPLPSGATVRALLDLHAAAAARGGEPRVFPIVQMAALIDRAAEADVRQRCLELLLGELLAVGSATRRAVFRDLLAVVLARAPDVSASLRGDRTASDALSEFFATHAARAEAVGAGGRGDDEDEESAAVVHGGGSGKNARRRPSGSTGALPADAHFDVAAKVAMQELFAGTLQSSDCLEASVMDVAVAMTPLMEATPELLDTSRDILSCVLRFTAERPRALASWSTQLISNVKTAIQLSIFDPDGGCALAATLLRSPLCSDSNLRRVVKSLSLLMHTLDRLRSEGYADMAAGMGVVALTLATVAREGERWPQSARAACGSLSAQAGQYALAQLCAALTAAVAVSNGFEPSQELARAADAGDEGTGAAANPDVGTVLGALTLLCESPQPWMGPTLRHALGGLVCLVVATDGAGLATVPPLVPHMSRQHQTIAAEVALRSLLDSDRDTPQEERLLLALIVAASCAPVSAADARAIVVLLFTINAAQVFCYERPSVVVAAAVLAVALRAGCDAATVEIVLADVSATYLCLDADARGELTAAAARYFSPSRGASEVRDLCRTLLHGRCAPKALLLMEMAALAPVGAEGEEKQELVPPQSVLGRPTLHARTADALTRLIAQCPDTTLLGRALWRRPGDGAFAAVRSVVCVALAMRQGGGGAADKASNLCVCLLSGVVAPEGGAEGPGSAAAPTVPQLLWVLQLLTTLAGAATDGLENGRRERGSVAWLWPVGALLARTTAHTHAAPLKQAVRQLGRDKGLILRTFMEQSVRRA